MNTTMSTVSGSGGGGGGSGGGSGGGDKRLPETTVQTVAQNLTTMQQSVQSVQSVPSVQSVQSVVQSSIQSIQPTQTIVGAPIGAPSCLVGKSVSLDMNPKLSLMKPVIPSGTASSAETSKITTTLCSLGSTVKIISPGMLSTVERQNPPQTSPHPVSMPATYHVPRGPAAVANISAPRSTVATPIVRTNTGQIVPTTRPGNTPISNPQWQPKTSVALYAQPQRHPTPPVSRVSRPSSTVYTTGQQPRLITPTSQGRSVQATMVTGSPSRLITPVLQTNLTRHPVAQNRPPTPQVTVVSQTSQPTRSSAQTIQPAQSSRPLTTAGTTKRIAVSTPIVETANRISSTASVTIGSVEPTVARQLSISGNTVAGPSTVSHIVIPSQQVQPQQGAPRVVQTVTSLSSLSTVSQVITTTTNTQSNAMRILQTVPTTVAKLTGMSLHSLPIALPVRAASAPIKAAPAQPQNIGQTVQVKPAPQANLRMSSNNSSTATSSAQPVQGQYIHTPHTTTTYLSFETTGTYSPFRQASVQPVRLVVEPGYEEPHSKPNASPRPSILRKRDHDNSPVKGIIMLKLVSAVEATTRIKIISQIIRKIRNGLNLKL
ncbi:PREDICTED: histone deacetylase complex subunit SAP130-like isoform X2 [Vollenhovia emeryi]|nr:PREDICTED: histone deacetylase complex subunit SAP130-like isoform X2 [Vollenhovia emeryi]